MVEPVHADPRLELVDMDALDLDDFPPLEEWSEFDWQEAIRITRYDRALTAHQPGDPDPRLHLIDLQLLDLDKLPPLEAWSEDEWDDAMLITRSAMVMEYNTKWVPLEQVIEKHGFEIVDGELRRRE